MTHALNAFYWWQGGGQGGGDDSVAPRHRCLSGSQANDKEGGQHMLPLATAIKQRRGRGDDKVDGGRTILAPQV